MAIAVLKLVSLSNQMNDMLFWKHEHNGAYSVRSSYREIKKYERINTVGENFGAVDPFWNRLWKLQVPNKIKVFAWRTYQKSLLPYLSKLRQRLIINDELCPLYWTEVKDIYHALFECLKINLIWSKHVLNLVQQNDDRAITRMIQQLCGTVEMEKL